MENIIIPVQLSITRYVSKRLVEMKKSNFAVFVVLVMLLIFTSCATQTGSDFSSTSNNTDEIISTTDKEDGSMLDKLHQIQSDWTMEQVHELLGSPDERGQASVVPMDYYNISDTTRATIYYWSEGIRIELVNTETGEATTILG